MPPVFSATTGLSTDILVEHQSRVQVSGCGGSQATTTTKTTTMTNNIIANSSSSSTRPIVRRRRRYQRHQALANEGGVYQIMSTGKRLAKRSIIGTRVCAPGKDGYYYSGVISAVNTPTSPQQPELNGLSITPDTRYSVRFDPLPIIVGGSSFKPPDSKTEYSDRDLIGPGFASVIGAKLVNGQKVYLTYNGREIQAEVTEHRQNQDEVDVVVVVPPPGQEVYCFFGFSFLCIKIK